MRRREYLAQTGTLGLSTLLSGCSMREKAITESDDHVVNDDVGSGSNSNSDPPASTPPDPAEKLPPYVDRFDRIVDAVQDLGVDPTGERSVTEAFSEVGSNVLITLPDGKYRLEGEGEIGKREKFGIHGIGDATLVVPEGSRELLLNVFETNEIVFANFRIDQRARDAVGSFRFHATEGLYVGNLHFEGRGIRRDGIEPSALNVALRDESGTGTVENVVSKKGSAWAHYNEAQGRIGVWIGSNHHGRIQLTDLDLREFGNNALYCSRTPGDVQVRGGYYENNNAANIRISGAGSYVDGATIVVDPSRYTGPRTKESGSFALRPIVVEQATRSLPMKPAGCEVRNCRIVVKDNPAPFPAIHVYPNGRSLRVKDTEIVYDAPRRPVIFRDEFRHWGRSRHPPGRPPRGVTMENVEITGRGGTSAVRIVDGDGSEIRNCEFVLRGPDTNGIEIVSSTGCLIESTTVGVRGEPTVFEDSDPEVTDLAVEEVTVNYNDGEVARLSPLNIYHNL